VIFKVSVALLCEWQRYSGPFELPGSWEWFCSFWGSENQACRTW